MFSIKISISSTSKTGLEALDWRRSHGLPDGVSIQCDNYKETFSVSESFARKWFRLSEVTAFASIDMDDLASEDVAIKPHFKNGVAITLSQERAEKLFIRHRSVGLIKDDDSCDCFPRETYPKVRLTV